MLFNKRPMKPFLTFFASTCLKNMKIKVKIRVALQKETYPPALDKKLEEVIPNYTNLDFWDSERKSGNA